jgi:hypothetical protein
MVVKSSLLMEPKAERTTVRKLTSIKENERHLAYIEERTQEYLAELAKNDLQDNSITITKIAEKIERLKKRILRYELLEEN